MTLEGIDALNPPSSAQIKAAGKSFVVRYTRNVTVAELMADRVAGLATVLVFETSGVDFTGLAAQGQLDAQLAQQQMSAVGVRDQPVYFAIDASTSLLVDVNDYLSGCAGVVGLQNTGVYGSYSVVSAALAGRYAAYAWQTYAWSNGQLDPNAHLYQYLNGQTLDGFTVDLDRTVVSDTDFGQIKWGSLPLEDEMLFWAKDPSSAACVLTNGAWAVGIPDDATLQAYQKAGVPNVGLSQAAFNALVPFAQTLSSGGLSAAQSQQLSDAAAAVARIEAAMKGA